jgi:hypothetical protein
LSYTPADATIRQGLPPQGSCLRPGPVASRLSLALDGPSLRQAPVEHYSTGHAQRSHSGSGIRRTQVGRNRTFVEDYLAAPFEKALARKLPDNHMSGGWGYKSIGEARKGAHEGCGRQRPTERCVIAMEDNDWIGHSQRAESVMTETGRGRPQRHRTLKAGKIVLSHGTSVVDCTIRNLSPEGAAIAVDNAATLPAEFDLKFDGETRHCKVAWRRLNRLGVKFG